MAVVPSAAFPLVKIVLIGDMGVGKTCLLYRFLENDFVPWHTFTLGIDYRQKTLQVKGKQIKLQIFDTAGQERFFAITKAYYRGAHGVLLVYDVTTPGSLDHIIKWAEELETSASTANKILVGNKCDMEEARAVSTVKGQEVADRFGCKLVEASAKSGNNVEKAFLVLIEDIVKRIIPDEVAGGSATSIVPSATTTIQKDEAGNQCSC